MAIEDIKELADRIPDILRLQPNEAQTNQWLVEPFIEALGYRISDPTQVERESTADYGPRQSYKVDYVIKSAGVPIIVIECKKASDSLKDRDGKLNHTGQLSGYFGATVRKIAEAGGKKELIGILTNGLTYLFFTDQVDPNIMDGSPFWEIDVRSLDSKTLEQLGRVERGHFNAEDAVKGASELNYIAKMKETLTKHYNLQDDDRAKVDDGFVNWLLRPLLPANSRMTDEFKEMAQKALVDFVEELVVGRLRGNQQSAAPSAAEETPSPEPDESPEETSEETVSEGTSTIVTTDEELQGYEVVKTIVGEVVDPEKVIVRDSKSYCAIHYENNRKPLCRLYFDGEQKRLGLFDGSRSNNGGLICSLIAIESVDDIHTHAEQLRETARRYLES